MRTKEGTKQLNIEALRIIAMLLIIMGHSIGHTYLLDFIPFATVKYQCILFIRVICSIATNVYVLISGYLLCQKPFKIKRVFSLWLQVFFYSLLLYVVCLLIGKADFSFGTLLKVVLPISGNQYWFARVYFGLYLLSPFLNLFIQHLSKKQFQLMLLISVLLFSLWRSFLPFAVTLNSEGGNSIIWFIVLYFFGAYLKLHGLPERINSRKILVCVTIVMLLFAYGSIVCLHFISEYFGFGGKGVSLFSEFTAFPILFSAISVFAFSICNAERIKGRVAKVVLWFSESTFSVYLIHENRYIKGVLWPLINMPGHAGSVFVIPLIPFVAILIFVSCAVVDKLTYKQLDRLLKKVKFLKLQKMIDEFLLEK